MINYRLLDESISYYENKGFPRIESPWTVTEAVSNITKPKDAKTFKLIHEDNKVLVASGEQSFLYLYMKGFLPKGQYQTITPCFRGDSFDASHTKYFIKNELIKTDEVTKGCLSKLIDFSYSYFKRYFPKEGLGIEKIEDSYDITFKGEELGSYGIRECSFLKWIYGTGLAEPRTSYLIKKYGLSSE